jgi:surface antigen
MYKTIAAACLLAASSFIAATPAMADCQDVKVEGTVAGAIIGGVIGSQFGHGGGRTAATVGGVLLGGIAGNAIARDSCHDKRYDAYYYDNVYDDAFDGRDDDRRYEWENPYSHHHGYVRTTEYYEDGYEGHDGPCRAFEQRIWIDGDEQRGTGVACRRHDGSWKIISDNDD